MKRYLLFAYDHYYPQGGMDDCIAIFNSFEECMKELKGYYSSYDYYQILDTKDMRTYSYKFNGEYDTYEEYRQRKQEEIQKFIVSTIGATN
jgi:hypothetical protein